MLTLLCLLYALDARLDVLGRHGLLGDAGVEVPLALVRSEHDHHLLEPQMKQSDWNITGPWRYERINGAGHWLMLEKPKEINKLLLNFMKK